MARARCVLAIAATLLAVPSIASANGRFPYANQFEVSPQNPNVLYMRGTFGLMISEDGGKTFHWVCEEIMGFTQGLDPAYGLFAEGACAVAGFYGLVTSRDNGCNFVTAPAPLLGEYMIDLSVDRKDATKAVAVSATQKSDGTFHSQLYETFDSSATWSAVGAPFGPDDSPTNVDDAASRPDTVYVSGSTVRNGKRLGFLAYSTDRGAHWGETLVPDVVTLYLSAVDPTDPELLYVRTFEPNHEGDRLLVSKDGGKTLTTAAQIVGNMPGFAISPDGSKVAIGGPGAGVLVAPRETLAFVKKNELSVFCLKWTDDGFFACGPTQTTGPVLAVSSDDGATFTPFLNQLVDIQAPSQTCSETSMSAKECRPRWAALHERLTDPYAIPPSDAGVPDAGTSDAGTPSETPALSNCDCNAPAARTSGGQAAIGAALLLFFVARRRRGSTSGGRCDPASE